MNKVKRKSVFPIYIVGLGWFLYSLLFPLYRITDYLIVSVLSILLFWGVSFVISIIRSSKGYENVDTGDSYTDEMLITATRKMEELRLLRNAIINESLRAQIKDLENSASQIVNFIKQNPDRISKISQFFLYYLPTTIKLINNYKEFEMNGQFGDNLSMGMKEIEEFMSKLVIAYHKVLDDLFEDKAMDSSVDIDVMEKMLQQDEYLKNQGTGDSIGKG